MPDIEFIPFQVEDYCRAAMRDAAILAHDCGLGKTNAIFAWPWLKEAKRTLTVAPEGLHLQIEEVNRKHFGFTLIPLQSQEDFWRWGLDQPPEPGAEPVWFITSYHALGYNGADEWLPGDKNELGNPIDKEHLIEARLAELRRSRTPFDKEYFRGIGEVRHGIRCVWKPSLCTLIDQFNSFDCVVADEAVRAQSNNAHIATGLRRLRPRFRLLLTATPIKNRLESLFWLAWWVAGGHEVPTARWPYEGTSEDREQFANDHLQHDRFLTREKEHHRETRENRKISRRSPRLTNVHRVWKLIAPIIVRRRKEDCGEQIVPRILRPVVVKPSTQQARLYRDVLEAKVDAKKIVSTLMTLRQIALCPNSPNLGEFALSSPLNPKMMAVLEIIAECLARGEQVVVGSPFIQFTQDLERMLCEAGVPVVALDGSTGPAKRGKLAREFKLGVYPVLLAGVRAMGEGHSFENCPNLILPGLDLAYDSNKQIMDRVWRINSPKPVNVYTIALENTVDEQLAETFREKADSSQLALDGVLTPEDVEEMSAEELLIRAIEGFDPDAPTVHEHELVAAWDGLRERLRIACRRAAA